MENDELTTDLPENEIGEPVVRAESPKLSLREQVQLRKELERQKEEAQYTFRPSVPQIKKFVTKDNQTSRENRFDKLYGDALKKHITSSGKDTEDLTKRDKDLTFKPKISSMGAKQSRSSSRDRLGISRSGSQSRDSSRERGSLASSLDGCQNNVGRGRSGSNSRGRSTSTSRTRGVTKFLEEQQATMTFRPNITKRAKSIDRPEASNVVERLHDQGKKVKERIEQKKSDYELLRMQECTFAPSVVAKSKSSNNLSGMDVTERLHRFEEMKQKKLEEAQRRRQEVESEELTFKPKISPRAQSPLHLNLSNDVPLEERLMTPTKRRSFRAQEEADKELTFKPKLVAKRSSSPSLSNDYGSIHERLFVEGITHKRELELQAEMKRVEMDKDITFTPEINMGRVKVRDSSDGNLFERLSTYQKGEPDKIERLRNNLDAELTFHPQLTPKSLEIASHIMVESPAYERMKAEHDRNKREMELRHQMQEEAKLKEATFQPIVPESSKELAKRRFEACIDAGGDTASVFSMSVHSRLASMYTTSSANQSLAGTLTDSATIATELTGWRNNDQEHSRQTIVLPEEKVNELVRRLAVHKKVEEPLTEVKAKVISTEEYEGAIQRLSMHKTICYSLKTDPDQLEAVQPKLVKASPKVSNEKMEEILERLQSPTVSAVASTSSGGNLTLSTDQLNVMVSTAAAGAAAAHGSLSPSRRHTLMSPPKASSFGTTLAAISDAEEHHDDAASVHSNHDEVKESKRTDANGGVQDENQLKQLVAVTPRRMNSLSKIPTPASKDRSQPFKARTSSEALSPKKPGAAMPVARSNSLTSGTSSNTGNSAPSTPTSTSILCRKSLSDSTGKTPPAPLSQSRRKEQSAAAVAENDALRVDSSAPPVETRVDNDFR